MRSIRLVLTTFSIAIALVGASAGCPGCEPSSSDAGTDGGGPTGDGGATTDAGTAPRDGGGIECDENTEGFGEPCAAQDGDPLCGNFICCTEGNPFCGDGQLLFCYDLGPNDCGGCGELDVSAGRVGDGCGEYGCGFVKCNAEGTATECQGDHPRNDCGGCEDLPPDAGPGDVCSSCQTGTQTCTRDMNDLVCWYGRSDDNSCGSCGRCVLAHANMDERFFGGYIRTGTTALVEDIGGGTTHLIFDPLVEGPGANGLPETYIYLSVDANLEENHVRLQPPFSDTSDATSPTGADPVRSFAVSSSVSLETYHYVVLYDVVLDERISVGELLLGPPAGFDAGVPPLPVDGGSADAGPDAGGPDGGAPDAGTADAGMTPSPMDAGQRDAGTPDAG